jgi:WD40 repeat protein
MLLVTTGCDILQLDAKKNCDIAMSGHCRNELWGLAVSNQTDDNFVTAGDDGTVRLWSISQRKMLSRVLIKDRVIRGVDWSNDGKQIVAADNKAMLYMFNVSGNELKQSGKEFKTKTTDVILKRNSKKALSFVEEIKFSPNGRFIVFGAHAADSLIELVVVDRDTLKEYKVYKGNSSSLLHADWNKNSDIFSTNSQSYELMFYGVNDTKQISATACRNEDWATWTRKIGWQVLGIFQGVDFTDVNTVCADR